MKSERAALRETRRKLQAYDLSPAQLEQTKQTLIWLRDHSHDPRVRLNACKELRDGMFNLYEHENPAVQKIETKHNFPTRLSINIVKGKDGKTDPA